MNMMSKNNNIMTKFDEIIYLKDYTGEYAFKDILGEVVSRGYYKDGNKHGIWHYFSMGNIVRETRYNEGFKDGVEKVYAKTYLPDNITQIFYLNKIINYKNGVEHGETIVYASDGVVRSKIQKKNGLNDGLSIDFYSNGSIYTSKVFFQGEKISEIYYNEDNKSTRTTKIVDGITHNTYLEQISYSVDEYPHRFSLVGEYLSIGCKTKTIKEWDEWFKGTEQFDTPRGTKDFERIENMYNRFKELLIKQNAI